MKNTVSSQACILVARLTHLIDTALWPTACALLGSPADSSTHAEAECAELYMYHIPCRGCLSH
jgi:hypothetical protein